MNQWKQWWEQLKPLERRWAVAAGCLVFFMLNYFFIWPHRHDWARDDARSNAAAVKINDYNKEIAKKGVYETKLRVLQAGGEQVLPEDQAIDFVHFYSSCLYTNHVVLLNGGTLTTRSNAQFTEQQLGINVQANETNLVSFLYSLAAGNSMVRVRAMNLHPTPDHHELNAGITMIASYLKKVAPAPSKNSTTATPAKNVVAPKAPASAPRQVPASPSPGSKRALQTPPPGSNPMSPSNRMARFLRPGSVPSKP